MTNLVKIEKVNDDIEQKEYECQYWKTWKSDVFLIFILKGMSDCNRLNGQFDQIRQN